MYSKKIKLILITLFLHCFTHIWTNNLCTFVHLYFDQRKYSECGKLCGYFV